MSIGGIGGAGNGSGIGAFNAGSGGKPDRMVRKLPQTFGHDASGRVVPVEARVEFDPADPARAAILVFNGQAWRVSFDLLKNVLREPVTQFFRSAEQEGEGIELHGFPVGVSEIHLVLFGEHNQTGTMMMKRAALEQVVKLMPDIKRDENLTRFEQPAPPLDAAKSDFEVPDAADFSGEPYGEATTGTAASGGNTEVQWRYQKFLQYFSPEQAQWLAERTCANPHGAFVDFHRVKNMIDGGQTPEQVLWRLDYY